MVLKITPSNNPQQPETAPNTHNQVHTKQSSPQCDSNFYLGKLLCVVCSGQSLGASIAQPSRAAAL